MESKKVLISLFLAFLIISSIAGFIVSSPTNSNITGGGRIQVGDYSFAQTNQGYITYVGEDQVLISSDPRNIQLYQGLEEFTLERLNSASKVYLTLDPLDNLQSSFAYFDANIRPRLNKRITAACTADSPGCETLPLITCENATPANLVIQIDKANSTSLAFNNNCLLVQGNQVSLQLLFDSLILDLLLY